MGLLASLSVVLQVRFAVKPAACATSVGLGGGCRLEGGGQNQGGGRSRHRCREAEPPRATFHVSSSRVRCGPGRPSVGTPPDRRYAAPACTRGAEVHAHGQYIGTARTWSRCVDPGRHGDACTCRTTAIGYGPSPADTSRLVHRGWSVPDGYEALPRGPAAYHAPGDRIVHESAWRADGTSDPLARRHHGGLPGPGGRPAGQHPAREGEAAADLAVQSAGRPRSSTSTRAGSISAADGTVLAQSVPTPAGTDTRRLSVHYVRQYPQGPLYAGDHRVRLRPLLRHRRHRAAVRRLPVAHQQPPQTLSQLLFRQQQPLTTDNVDAERRAAAPERGLAGPDDAAAGREQGRGGRGDPAVDGERPGHGVEPHLRPQRAGGHRRCRPSSWPTSATPRRTTRASSRSGPSPPARPSHRAPP